MTMGERIKASNFAEMLRIFIDKLYELDPSLIESMARSNENILEWSSVVMFSYDYKLTWGSNLKVADSEIYESSGFSAATIMCIIRALVDRYGLDRSDFVYSARDNKKKLKKLYVIICRNMSKSVTTENTGLFTENVI